VRVKSYKIIRRQWTVGALGMCMKNLQAQIENASLHSVFVIFTNFISRYCCKFHNWGRFASVVRVKTNAYVHTYIANTCNNSKGLQGR
jgi:hypothetical protein